MRRRHAPTGAIAFSVESATSGRKEPTNGDVPAVMAVPAASSNVVRLASAPPVPKFAPAPLPELRSTDVPSGAISVRFRSESIGAPSQSEPATLVSGPPDQVATAFVDSMVPTSGTLVTVLLSNRTGTREGVPLLKATGI